MYYADYINNNKRHNHAKKRAASRDKEEKSKAGNSKTSVCVRDFV
jgi:hypothetical protein